MAPADHSSMTAKKRRRNPSPTGVEESSLKWAAQSGQTEARSRRARPRAWSPAERAATRAIRLMLAAVVVAPFARPRAADATVAAA